MATVFIGIDVARDELVIAVRPAGELWPVANDPAAIAALVPRLQSYRPRLIVLEATGGLELPLLAALGSAGLPVVAVNPRQVRDFAKARGTLAKTDALDAHVLAHFAAVVRPAVRPLPDAATRELAAASWSRCWSPRRTAARAPRRPSAPTSTPTSPGCARASRRPTPTCAEPCGPAPSGAPARICCAACPASAPSPASCCSPSCPNWAPSTASRSPPSSAWRRSIAIAAPGVAAGPSGVGAPPSAPCSTWPALVGTRHNPALRALYQRLRAARKPKKLALTACMRKLLTSLNAMLKHRTRWAPAAA